MPSNEQFIGPVVQVFVKEPARGGMLENVYLIADSNHGYKMIGVGALVAREILGAREEILEPFRFARYAAGNLHPVSHSPYPWS